MIKKIATINDLSGFGKCSLTVAIPIISALKVQACPMPTAVLSNQTGYPQFFIKDCTEDMGKIAKQWEKLKFQFDGIYTGFLSDEKQVGVIEKFIEVFKTENNFLLVDPVMGDDGEVYPNFSPKLIQRIKDLVFMADIVTPNITEACILTDYNYQNLMEQKNTEDYLKRIEDICHIFHQRNVKKIVITGIHYKAKEDLKEMLYNAVMENGKVVFVKQEIVGGSYSGTGDILASIICALTARGKTLLEAVKVATEFISLSIKDTFENGIERNEGVNFEKFLDTLTKI